MHNSFYIKTGFTSTIFTIYLLHKSILFDFSLQIIYSKNISKIGVEFMEFKFKRKYTFFFFLAILLHVGALSFWLFSPDKWFNSPEVKKIVCLLILINIELILVFYLGLFRKKYHAYHDRITIRRSFFSGIVIFYKDIIRIKEKNNDSILLGFGHRPSFTIYYNDRRKKKYIVRADNTELLLKVIKNEIDIANLNNKDKKFTK